MVVITPIRILLSRELTSDEQAAPAFPRPGSTAGAGLLRPLAMAGADAAALAACFAAAALVAPHGAALLPLLALSAFAVLAAFLLRGDYDVQAFRRGTVRDAVLVPALAMLGTGFAAFLSGLDATRLPLLVMWGAALPALPLARAAARLVLRRAGVPGRPVVLVGGGETLATAMRLLRRDAGRDCAVVAVLDPGELDPMRPGTWSALLRRHGATLVVLALDESRRDLVDWLVRDHVAFAVVPRAEGLPVRGTAAAPLFDHEVEPRSYRSNLRRPARRAAKMALDLGGAAVLLVALAPLFALIAVLVKLDGGQVLYAHYRIGAGGRRFPCLKFRSMVPDSEAVLRRTLAEDPAAAAEWAETQKLRNDPRVTLIGGVLRRTSLDELPQLLNVLRLEMSLVGPRPIVEAEVARYGEDIHLYYATRPGLTGLWQVSGRSDTGYGQRVRLDSWYVTNWSLRHDLLILARTVPAVLKRRGAV